MMGEIYDGQKNQKAIEEFRPIVKRGFNQYLSDTINEMLKNVQSSTQHNHKVRLNTRAKEKLTSTN
jgi:hypothetical protein